MEKGGRKRERGETERQRETDRQTETDRDRETDSKTLFYKVCSLGSVKHV